MPVQSALHETFCGNVRRHRQELGLSQYEMADRLGMRQPSYYAIEAGRRAPGLLVIEKLALVFDCAPAELLAGEKIPA